jgi:hypothetical protein
MGPLVASATRSLHKAVCGSEYGALEAVMCWPVVVSIVSIAGAFCLPEAEEYIDADSQEFKATQLGPSDLVDVTTRDFVEEPDYSVRRVGILISVLIIGVRAAIVSGLEAATAMVLERDYQMDKGILGVLIGLTFLVSVPARAIFTYCKDWISIRGWIRLTMCFSLLGSLFLFRKVESLVVPESGGAAALLLMADSLLYCSIFQVSGLVEGIMTTFALPVGSLFTVDTVIVLKILALDCVGRLIGPPLARMQVEAGGPENGQDGYAWQQMSMTLLATLLTEAVLLRVMDIVEAIPRRTSIASPLDGADDTDAPKAASTVLHALSEKCEHPSATTSLHALTS